MERKTINCVQGDNTHRLIIIGANGVGKTSLVTTFIGKENKKEKNRINESKSENQELQDLCPTRFYESNMCLSYESLTSDFRIVRFEVQVMDDIDENPLSSDDNGKTMKITPNLLDGCLCVFDISQKRTFDACTKLRDSILKFKVSQDLSTLTADCLSAF